MRIWVTRPEPAAGRTGARLAALGYAPLVAPVLVVASTDDPCPPGPFAGVILTSANAVAPLAACEPCGCPIVAVGPRTAAVAREAGLADVTQADGDAAALARLVRAQMRPPGRLLHVAGHDRKGEPEASLRAAGFTLVVWEAYRARPVAALPAPVAAALREGALDAVVHYSRRSAATALDLAAAAGLRDAFAALAHHALSDDVAAPLSAAEIAVRVAALPDGDALIATLPLP